MIQSSVSTAINHAWREDENVIVPRLVSAATLDSVTLDAINVRARNLVTAVREQRIGKGGLDAFLHEFELSSAEGVVLMCLAEALLRIPDNETADLLIRDKLSGADWENHLGQSDSLFVNASTWALMLTGRVVEMNEYSSETLGGTLGRMVSRLGEPVIRQSVTQGMRIMGRQFVMGRTIEEALDRALDEAKRGYTHSFDMLGEAAFTAADAQRYFNSYVTAIEAIGANSDHVHDPVNGPGISVKLSAIHPRYEFTHSERIHSELSPKLLQLAETAARHNIGLTIDAEEADRLQLSLEVFESLATAPSLKGWDGLGLAVQAYQKRALPVLDWLAQLAHKTNRRLMVRLVKGAYWDTEIKRAQEQGVDGYPVFTRKPTTDVSYLACAKRMLADPAAFYPQFATHNAHTVSAIREIAGTGAEYEFQRLHGMGEALYGEIVGKPDWDRSCRVYAPVGSHKDLLAYLVRRLLENGANTSFVNRIVDEDLPIDRIIADPVARIRDVMPKPHPDIPAPREIFDDGRLSARGLDLADPNQLSPVLSAIENFDSSEWRAGPIIGGVAVSRPEESMTSPSQRSRSIGRSSDSTEEDVDNAMSRASRAFTAWDGLPATRRAEILERAADIMEEQTEQLMALCVHEAGKTINDAIAEVREAVDFCRYYAAQCSEKFSEPLELPGPTGETNHLMLAGRGVFVCISPWNFPLAIFCGQITAALAAGNCVVAKPAEQTTLIAAQAVRILHRAGVPGDALHLLPGPGRVVGSQMISHPATAGVVFTGSTTTAKIINRRLAEKDGPIVPLIAETGGQNAMIVDSSALPEQVVADAIASAFQSAGQRCSALRVMCIQTDIADRVITMLSGAMEELNIGDPTNLHTDVGPVIDEGAKQSLEQHAAAMEQTAKLVYQCTLSPECSGGSYFAPRAFEIQAIDQLGEEVFGPFLHIVRFEAHELDELVASINNTGYGLTLGIHSRIDSTIDRITAQARVGNVYVNRNQIGAVVGVQPFGGEGLSGTGPKAGGPHYLSRFAVERTRTVNTTAQGGNTELISIQEKA